MSNHNDDQAAPEPQMSLDLTIGFDGVGDPVLHLTYTGPEGGGAMQLDDVEALGLHMIRSVAMARSNAAVSRKLMLDGMPAQQVVHFLRDVLMR